jgi:hypothetical protein
VKSARVIADTILACLKAQGLTVVRINDTQWGSDEQDAAFAKDVAANAVMAMEGEEGEEGEEMPSQQLRSAS